MNIDDSPQHSDIKIITLVIGLFCAGASAVLTVAGYWILGSLLEEYLIPILVPADAIRRSYGQPLVIIVSPIVALLGASLGAASGILRTGYTHTAANIFFGQALQ